MAASLRTHTAAVADALTSAGIATFLGAGPTDPYGSAPYVVLYAGTASYEGTSAVPDSDVEFEVQVTAIGITQEQAYWLADGVAAALDGAALTPPTGRAWLRPGRPVNHVLTRPCERDDDAGPGQPIFYVVALYALPSTPA